MRTGARRWGEVEEGKGGGAEGRGRQVTVGSFWGMKGLERGGGEEVDEE